MRKIQHYRNQIYVNIALQEERLSNHPCLPAYIYIYLYIYIKQGNTTVSTCFKIIYLVFHGSTIRHFKTKSKN